MHDLLRENVRQADATGQNELTPQPPRRSRRKRDFWLLMTVSNGFFGLVAVHTGPSAPIAFVSALAGVAVASAALTWVMWFVMDDY